MARKKQAENPATVTEEKKAAEGVTEGKLEIAAPQQPSPINPAEKLAKILEMQEQRTAKLEAAFAAQGQQLLATQRALNSVMQRGQEEGDQSEQKPKPLNPMEIMKTITDILNNPMIQKVVDKFLGGTEEPAPETALPTPQEIKQYQELAAYRDGRMRRMDEMQESWMNQMVDGLKLANEIKKKELESDLT